MLRKKLKPVATLLALFAGLVMSYGTAHATCTFGQSSPITYGTDLISSQVFGSQFVFYGQNQPPWNGGYGLALTQRYDNRSDVTTGVIGVAYTSQVTPNGAVNTVTTPYNNLQNRAIHYLYPNSGYKISNLQVVVYYCG